MRIMYIITQYDTLTISPGNLSWKCGGTSNYNFDFRVRDYIKTMINAG